MSRTFAINITVLRGDLHKAVLVAYLFCRIADTVEDSENLSTEERNQLLDAYIAIFANRDFSPKTIADWTRQFRVDTATNHEHILIENSIKVFETFMTLPDNTRDVIGDCVIEMSKGMKETINRKKAGQITTIETVEELDKYCYYVAGTVGVMLTRLFRFYANSMSSSAIALAQKLQVSFGLGLQVTNIIKDSHKDFQRGWCYIPSELITKHGVSVQNLFVPEYRERSMRVMQELILKAAGHLDDALVYTLAIPRRELRMRLFCLWPLFFAIKTLNAAWKNPNLLSDRKQVKITRWDVYKTIGITTIIAISDTLLKRYYKKLRKGITTDE